jgi:hypothetical protein
MKGKQIFEGFVSRKIMVKMKKLEKKKTFDM